MKSAMLSIAHLSMRFGGITALDDVSFSLNQGEITSLIGPNGAGKTTLFNCITGMYTPSQGQVHFNGTDITGMAAYQIAQQGMARTFQNLALFGGLTVLENLMTGAYLQGCSGLLQGFFTSPKARREKREAHAAAMEMLTFPRSRIACARFLISASLSANCLGLLIDRSNIFELSVRTST